LRKATTHKANSTSKRPIEVPSSSSSFSSTSFSSSSSSSSSFSSLSTRPLSTSSIFGRRAVVAAA